MAKKTYTPENTALCESLINAILSNAPDGVNIKAAAVRRVAAVRWSAARCVERVRRCAFVAYGRPVRGCRRVVVRSVAAVRWSAARWRGALALRAVRLANIVAFACITCARRLDDIADDLGNM